MELGDIIVTIGRILNNLEKIQEEKGVPNANQNLIDKNINNSSLGKKKETSALSSSDKKKLSEVFSLFNESFFSYQKKQKEDTAQQTLISKVERQNKPKEIKPTQENKKGFNLLDFLLPLVGGVALIGAAIPTLIAALFDKVGFAGDAMKVLGKVGLMGGLKLLAGTFLKRFALTALKRIPYVGGLISLFFAYKEFKAGRIIPGLIEIVSGLANFVPFVGPILSIGVDVLKAFLESKGTFDEGGALGNANAWSSIKGWMSSIGTWIWDNALYIPIVGTFKRLGMAWDAFESGNWKEGLKQTLYGLISIIPGGGFLIKGYEWLSSYLSLSKEEQQVQINEGGVMGTVKGWISSIGQYIAANSLNLPIIGGIQRFGMAWDLFKNGNWSEGFKTFGEGILAFIGGGPLINGFNMISGWLFGNETEDSKSLSPDGSWKDRLKSWIKGKLHKLPAFLRKPLEWFGILDETDSEAGNNAKTSEPKAPSQIKEKGEENEGFFSKIADSVGSGIKNVADIAGNMFSGLTTLGKDAFDAAFKKFSEILPELQKYTEKIFNDLSNMINTSLPEIKPKISALIDDIYSSLFSAFNSTKPAIIESISGLLLMIKDTFNSTKPAIIESIGGLLLMIKDTFNSTKPAIIEYFSPYLEQLKNIFSNIISDINLIMVNAMIKLSDNVVKLTDEISNDKYKVFNSSNLLDRKKESNVINQQNNETIKNISINNDSKLISDIITQASYNECKYLEALVNINNQALYELKKINKLPSEQGNVFINKVQPPPQSNISNINLNSNRSGYAESVYALG